MITLKDKITAFRNISDDFNHMFCVECEGNKAYSYCINLIDSILFFLEDTTYEEQRAIFKDIEGLEDVLSSFRMFKSHIKSEIH